MKNYLNKILISFFTVISLGFSQDNYSLHFDFMSGYAVSELSSEAIFGDNYTFTVEVWYKNDGVNSGNNQGLPGNGANILANYKRSGGGDPYNNFTLQIVPENHGPIGTFNMQGAYSVERYDDGQWHHVVGIVEKISDNESRAILYVDGEYISETGHNETDFISSYNKIYINNHSPFAGDHMMDCSVAGIRVSSGRRYTENFSPEFPLSADDQTIFNLDFSSGNGSTLSDLSSNGHDFAIQGSATWSDDIPVLPVPPTPGGNNSLSFDGTDDYAFVSSTDLDNIFSGYNPFTVSLWVFGNNLEVGGLFGKGSTPNNGGNPRSVMLYRQADVISFILYSDVSEFIASHAYQEILDPGVWNNITVSYDGGTNPNSLRFYKEGIPYDNVTEQTNGTYTGVRQVAEPFYLGARVQDNGVVHQALSAIMDEVTVWDRALSDQEIQSYFSTSPAGNEDGLYGYWNLNEGEGSVLTDLSDYGNNGTVVGATWSGNSAPVEPPVLGCTDSYADNYDSDATADDGTCSYPDNGDYSLSFDGNSYVSIPAGLLDYDEPRTILLQVKNNGGGTLYSNFTNETGEYAVGVWDNGSMFQLKGQNGWAHAGDITETINDEWMYVVGTWDLNEIKLYENGILVNSTPLQGPLAQNTFNGSAGIGVSAANWNGWYNGNIAKVAVWNRALNQTEISELSNEVSVLDFSNNLVSFWPFNEGSGDFVADISGNANHGTINGATWSEDVYVPPVPPVPGGNNSLSFDGVDDYVDLGSSDLIAGSSYSIEVKLKKTIDNQNYMSIISSGPRLHGNMEAQLYSPYQSAPYNDNKIGLSHWMGGEPISEKELENDIWYHLAFTYDFSSSVGKVFIDGQLEGSNTLGFNFGNGGNYQPANFLLGKNMEGFFLNGNIDEVRIWNTVRTQEELEYYLYSPLNGNEDDLVGYWNFNEGEGNTLTDLSGNGNDGTIYGATWSGDYLVPPVYGCTDPYAENYNPDATVDDGSCSYPDIGDYSLSFDGETSGVSGTASSSLDVSGNNLLTLSGWVKPSDNLENPGVIFAHTDNFRWHQYALIVNPDGRLYFISGLASFEAGGNNLSNGQIPLGDWSHIALTYDGTAVKFYINGENDFTHNVEDTFGTNYMGDFHIGHADGDSRYNGLMDEINVWNIALNEEQIQTSMNFPLDGNESGLVGYWKFNSGDGDILYDHSGNANHGTINGATWSEDFPYTGPEWFVSSDGDDSNNGSQEQPFASIQQGINAANNGDTVLVAAGTYVENINYNGKNIAVNGADKETTVIDGNQSGSVVTILGDNDFAMLKGFTITNGEAGLFSGLNSYCGGGVFVAGNMSVTLTDLIIHNNSSQDYGAGIAGFSNNLQISNSIIHDNSSSDGGGIYLGNSQNVQIRNNIFYGNSATDNGGGLSIQGSNIQIDNCTIFNNENHGLFLGFGSTVNINESAFSNNSLYEIKFRQNNGTADLYIEYSFIEDEQNSIYINGYGTVTWGEGNIDGDPLFCNVSGGDFTLAENSPLISAGEFGADIGALGVGCEESFNNYSLSFDGVDDYVAIPTSTSIDQITTGLTLSAWINPHSYSDGAHTRIFNRTEGTGGGVDRWLFTWSPSSDNYTVNFGGGASFSEVKGNTSIQLNRWTNVIVTFENSLVKIYVDGNLDSEGNVDFNELSFVQNADITIGSANGNSYFPGKIDNVSIWNRPLSESEIQSHMNIELLGVEEGLVGYWNFNEGEGTTLADVSTNGNNGQVEGATWSIGAPIDPAEVSSEPQVNAILSGTVTRLEDDSPISGAFVVAVAEDNSFSAETYSDDGGSYSLDLVGSINYYINISYEGLVDHNDYMFAAPYENTVLNASLDVLENGLVEGTLRDWYTNAPLSGASVLFAYTDDSDEVESIEATTDESGYFMVQVPGEQDYDLFLYAEGYWVEHDAFFLGSGESQVLSIGIAPMASASRLYGTVRDFESGELIPYAEVQLNCETASDWDHTGELGTYRVFNYYPGDCANGILVVTASGYETSVQSVGSINFEAGSSSDLDVTLAQGDDPDPGMISGTVNSNIDDSPIGGATIDAYNVSTTQLFSTSTFDNGSYQLYLPESEYYISVNAENHEQLFDTLSVFSGQSYGLDFNLEQVFLDTLYGTITDQSGQLLSDIQVVSLADGQLVGTTFTNEAGEYEFVLPYGVYDIGAGSNNYSRQFEYEFDFTSGFAGLDFVLEQVQQFDGGVAGIVHLNEGDNSTVFINIWNNENTYNDYTYSDENGAYAMQLLNGTYNIYAWAEGYEAFYVGNAFTVENNVVSHDIYFIAPDGPEAPTIVFLEDVPNDQGGQMELAWTPGNPQEFEIFPQYSVWRLDDEDTLIAIVPYHGFDLYNMVVPTLGDSTDDGIFQSTFMVTAHTIDVNVFFDSDPLTGYSVDNIFPAIPGQLLATFSGETVDLEWSSPSDDDFDYFNIYRQDLGSSESATVFSSEENFYTDEVGYQGEFEYWVTAVDVSGNESNPSDPAAVTLALAGDLVPSEFALQQNYPNPFNPSTQIRYALPTSSHVKIVVYNMLGSKVRTLYSGEQEAGFRNILWNATNDQGDPVSAGMYIYTIEAGGYFASKKMILLK